MFGRKEAQPQKRIDGLIAAGTIVRGDVIFSGGLRIDGTVEGKISTNNGEAGTLVISEQAQVDGEIKVSHVVVNGTVRGHGRIDWASGGKVTSTGDFSTANMDLAAPFGPVAGLTTSVHFTDLLGMETAPHQLDILLRHCPKQYSASGERRLRRERCAILWGDVAGHD